MTNVLNGSLKKMIKYQKGDRATHQLDKRQARTAHLNMGILVFRDSWHETTG
jgi:hypothetical protein